MTASDGKHNIVWLASYPKSGNTWFRVVLSNLFSDLEAPVSVNKLLSTPIASSRIQFDESIAISSSDLTFEEIDELRAEVYRTMSEESDDLVFSKVHDAWKLTGSGKPMFPPEITKAVIYIVRNPLDVAVSFSYHSKQPIEIMVKNMCDPGMKFCDKSDKLHRQLRQELGNWSDHVRSWTEHSGLPVHIVKYEDLLKNPLKYYYEALKFAGLSPGKNELKRAIEFSSFENLSESEDLEGFEEKPIKMEKFFRSGKAGNWSEHLSTRLVNKMIKNNYALMEAFGYLP